MQRIGLFFWGALVLLSLLWIQAEPFTPWPAGFFAWRALATQYSGVVAMGCMSLAMILALRPRRLEERLGGLDKMYRLHKWLGIGGLVLAVIHWLWAQGPKWAVGFGLLERPARGPRPMLHDPVEALFTSLRGAAEGVGEWSFYAAVLLIALALIQRVPYHLFYKTHRLLAVVYLSLTFHSVILMKFSYWTTPIGLAMAALLICGVFAAGVVLLRRVGAGRQIQGEIASIRHYPPLRVLEIEVAAPQGWPGHKAGQFAFVTSDAVEGAHPYTIASAWSDAQRKIVFIIKELGDHTSRLRETLRVGGKVKIEGPYGCFTFDDDRPHQIWVGGGIGVTPFIARMQRLAQQRSESAEQSPPQTVDLFHTTADYDESALDKLRADAAAAGVRLHILVDARDGRLDGDRIRAAAPQWRESSIWFCGPANFGQALRRDFARHGLSVRRLFHQELFSMR